MSVTARIRARGLAFARDRAGAALVEFAIVLPICLAVLMALIDFTRAFNERKRVTLVSSSLAELVSQSQTTDALTPSSLNSTTIAATAVMTPYPSRQLSITVSSIALTANPDGSCCRAKVHWSFTRGGVLRPCNVVLSQVASGVPPAPDNILASMVDASMLASSAMSQLIVVDVNDNYVPIFGEFAKLLAGGAQRTSYRALRGWGAVNRTGAAAIPPGGQARVCFTV